MKHSKSLMASILSMVILVSGVLSVSVHADYIDNPELFTSEQNQLDKAQLKDFFSTAEAQEKLIEMGVPPELAMVRIDQLTPQEVAQFNQDVENMPAGNGVLGIIVLFAVIFIITDVIGATDIFPFIKPVT
jgi:hypothetical protein